MPKLAACLLEQHGIGAGPPLSGLCCDGKTSYDPPEPLEIAPRVSFRAWQVVEALVEIAQGRARPRSLRVDNDPECAGRALDRRAYLNRAEIDVSRPGKPTDNAHSETFNGRLRAGCLNASWFLSMADARGRIEDWRRDYNKRRPPMAHGNRTPQDYALRISPSRLARGSGAREN